MSQQYIENLAAVLVALAAVLHVHAQTPTRPPDPTPEAIMARYATACGPIACYTALRTIALDASVQDMAARCRWQPGKTTSLAAMQQAFASVPGVSCQAVRLSPRQLAQYLTDKQRRAAILPVRRTAEELDHVVVAVAAKNQGDHIVIMDYPRLPAAFPLDVLADAWDGQSLLIEPHHLPSAPPARRLGLLLLVCGSVLGILLLVFLAKSISRRGTNNPTARPSQNHASTWRKS